MLGLICLLAADAFRNGFPAIRDGSLPLWSLKVDGHLPEAFSVVGYAFYMQVRCISRQGVALCSMFAALAKSVGLAGFHCVGQL